MGCKDRKSGKENNKPRIFCLYVLTYSTYKKYIKKVGDLILENFIGKNIEKNLNKVLESKVEDWLN